MAMCSPESLVRRELVKAKAALEKVQWMIMAFLEFLVNQSNAILQ